MDYKKLGLKCGIEIHQELATRKLFCRCPTVLRDDKPDIVITRKQRAVAGETGEIDVAAAHEMAKGKTFVYEAYHDTTCNVELDEEPPMPMDKEALDVVLQVSLMLKAKPVDEIQVMRKTVIDGSNTTGFQRTALVARNGILETSCGDVRIPTIMIEEDAARIMGQDETSATFRLDRLGTPLIEIGTEPDIKSPEQAKEAAEKIGMILRSTGRVKRGIGTIRQDVNISITNGNRIEIKGAQELKLIPTYVQLEVERQMNLIEIRNTLHGKEINITEPADVTDIFRKSESKIIRSCLEKKGVILALKLPHFKGFVGREIQPGRRLGTEFSDRAKMRAGVGGIFHTDELPNYGITIEDVKTVELKLKCSATDAFVLVADKKEKAESALIAVTKRALEALKGVPKEVRKPNPDGTTSFMRPMPGGARMYPETDVMPIKPDVSQIKMPELISDKSEQYQEEHGIGKDLAEVLAKSDKREMIEEFIKKFKHVKPAFIAETILSSTKEIKRKFSIDVDKISHKHYEEIFDHLDKGKISKDVVMNVLIDYAKGDFNISKYKMFSDTELEAEIKKIVASNKGLPYNVMIGKVMGQLKGKAAGEKITETVKRLTS